MSAFYVPLNGPYWFVSLIKLNLWPKEIRQVSSFFFNCDGFICGPLYEEKQHFFDVSNVRYRNLGLNGPNGPNNFEAKRNCFCVCREWKVALKSYCTYYGRLLRSHMS